VFETKQATKMWKRCSNADNSLIQVEATQAQALVWGLIRHLGGSWHFNPEVDSHLQGRFSIPWQRMF